MDTIWTYRCLIVTDAHVQFAREMCAAVAGPAGAGMWTTPLSPSGAEPATHWISAGLISEDFAALLPLTTFDEAGQPSTTPGNAALVAQLATANGMQTTAEQVRALFDVADVTEQDAQIVMDRLGLAMVKSAIEDTFDDFVE